MASTDLGLRHWVGESGKDHYVSLCGAAIMHPRSQMTFEVDYLTCEDCAIRVIAELHRQTAVLLKTLAGRVVALRAAAESAVKRD